MAALLDRWYTFLPWVLVLLLVGREFGWRRALALAAGGWLIAFAAEWSSTAGPGVPFGTYHYRTAGLLHDWRLLGVPVFDSVSFTWLSLCAYFVGGRLGLGGWRRLALATLAVVAVDVVVDPVALRGAQWWLGSIYRYPPHTGAWFGVSALNYVGWLVVVLAIQLWVGLWLGGERGPGRSLVGLSALLLLAVLAQSTVLAVLFGVWPSALVADGACLGLALFARGASWPRRTAPPDLVVACALAAEAARARAALGGGWACRVVAGRRRWRSRARPELEVWETGVGRRAARAAADCSGPALVLVAGLGGACTTDWELGAAGVGCRVLGPDGGWRELDPQGWRRLAAAGVGRTAALASLERPADAGTDRAALAGRGVDLADMETDAWLAEPADGGPRLLTALRTVSDTPGQPLGRAARLVRAGATGPLPLRVAALLARHPGSLSQLLRLGRQQAAALAGLRDALRRALPVLEELARETAAQTGGATSIDPSRVVAG